MEQQNGENSLQLLPLAINWIANSASGLLGDLDANQHYIMIQGCNAIHPEPVPVPQWMHPQQTPQNYVEILAPRGYPEIKKQISNDISTQGPSSGVEDPSQMEKYLRPHNKGNFVTAFTGFEHQTSVQNQNWNEEYSHAFQACEDSGTASSKRTSGSRQKRSKEKAYAADRCRRLRISHSLDALQELVPCSKEVGKVALLDNVIDYVKYLQYQLKDFCQHRLGGESTSNSFTFLEGHGHYIVQDQMLNGPLEDVMGRLIDVYPSAATELLQSRGLIVMPMTHAEELIGPTEMLGMSEEKVHF